MDGDEDDYPLTPRTEENYRRIDEQYARAMQHGTVKVRLCSGFEIIQILYLRCQRPSDCPSF